MDIVSGYKPMTNKMYMEGTLLLITEHNSLIAPIEYCLFFIEVYDSISKVPVLTSSKISCGF